MQPKLEKTIKQFNVTHVTIGIILNVMELITPNMKILKNLKNPIFAKSVAKISFLFNIYRMKTISPLKKELIEFWMEL